MGKMKEFLKRPFVIPVLALLFTLVFCVYILPINETIAFSVLNLGERATRYRHFYQFGFGIFLFTLSYFLLHFAGKLFDKDKFYIHWLKIAAIYLAGMSVFFLLMYPGHWVWDEFVIVKAVKEYSNFAWQGIFTNMYYTFCLYLFPTALSIIVFQLVFVATVVGYVVAQVRTLLPKGRAWWPILIPFAFIPVIVNNLYPLRLTLYAYLLLLFITRLVVLHRNKFAAAHPGKEFFGLCLLLVFVCFWRSEGIVYLAFIPYVAIKLGLFSVRGSLRTSSAAWCAGALILLAGSYYLTSTTADPTYKLTATINPLSTMLQKDLKGKHVAQDLASIDKVLDLKILKKYPSYEEVPAFWSNVVRPDFQPHTSEYNRAVLDLIRSNPGPYLENRSKAFLSTNTFGTTLPFVGEAKRFYVTEQTDPLRKAILEEFFATNKFTRPLNLPLHKKVTQSLLLVTTDWHPTPLMHLVWSLIPTLAALIGISVWLAFRKLYFWLIIAGALLAHTLALFLTAPANFFMYYFPIYLCGNFVVFLAILVYRDKRSAHAK